MLRIRSVPLGCESAERLSDYQKEVDQAGSYSERVTAGKRLFSKRNRKTNATFMHVRKCLISMCSGAQRCHYCEDSAGDEIEHFRPKELYPELVFAWSNYLLACGQCNRNKGSKFSVVVNHELKSLARSPTAKVEPPVYSGRAGVIDPRHEEPTDYLFLDLAGTFTFLPVLGLASVDADRARHTIDLLDLNREVLVMARREAYGSYRARLDEYRHLRDRGARPALLRHRSQAISASAHPTVWHEMRRLHSRIPELRELFTDVPEALEWRLTAASAPSLPA